MKQRLDGEAAWNRFMHTGRVKDYLAFCQTHDVADHTGPAPSGREDDHADYHQGLDRERTAYR